MKKLTAFVAAIFISISLSAQTDTTATKAGKSERNVMLNAESASSPREINIGLPMTGGATLFIDGNRHASGSLFKSRGHWLGGNSYEPVSTMSLIEAVIRAGEVGMMVVSNTKLVSEQQQTSVTLASSTLGLARVDAAASGPVRRGWYYTAGIAANFDPVGVPAPNRFFVDNKQVLNTAVSKRWDNAQLSLIYRFTLCRDNSDNTYNYAPFIYEGDGSITPVDGFRIGRDNYFPHDDVVKYMDVRTGEMVTKSMAKIDSRRFHDFSLRGEMFTASDWKLSLNSHLCLMPQFEESVMTPAGIELSPSGYALNGSTYTNPVQLRLFKIRHMEMTDWQTNLCADKKIGNHDLNFTAETVLGNHYVAEHTAMFAHTVAADPARLTYNGDASWDLNTNAAYVYADKFEGILFGFDKYSSSNLNNTLGARIRYIGFDMKSANVTPGSDLNKRVAGFNIADPSKSILNPIQHSGWDGAVSDQFSYRIAGRFFFNADGFWSMVCKESGVFKGTSVPSLKPVGNALGRGGFSYDNSWMDVMGLVSYITSWNNAKVMNVTAVVNGVSETIPWTAQYGIGTLGLTLDGNVHFGGFKLHTLVTWQDPRYKNYDNHFVFSDGSAIDIDYTNKYVTGISKWMFEFDPSYNWQKMRLWASVRYDSKQYASRNNLAYFNGHFETFAGLDYRINEKQKVSLNAVNLLFQNGVKGSVDTADTVEDAALLQGILLAGTFIRPFSLELSYSIRL